MYIPVASVIVVNIKTDKADICTKWKFWLRLTELLFKQSPKIAQKLYIPLFNKCVIRNKDKLPQLFVA